MKQVQGKESHAYNIGRNTVLVVSKVVPLSDFRADLDDRHGSSQRQIYNKYNQDVEIVRAALCAGLFPNVVQCKARGKRSAFFAKEDGKVEPNPASFNACGLEIRKLRIQLDLLLDRKVKDLKFDSHTKRKTSSDCSA